MMMRMVTRLRCRCRGSRISAAARPALAVICAAGLCWFMAVAPVAAQLPRLRLLRIDSTAPVSPRDGVRPAVLGADGSVVLVADAVLPTQLVLLAPDGDVMSRFGRRGSGPGEVQNPIPVWLSDRSVQAFDVSGARLVSWTRSGKVLDEGRLLEAAVPVGTPFGMIGLRFHQGAHFDIVRFVRDTGATLRPVTLVGVDDPFLRAAGGGGTVAKPRYAPLLGYWRGGFVVANPNDYSLAMYDTVGSFVRSMSRDVDRPTLRGARLDRLVDQIMSRRDAGAKQREQQNHQIRDGLAATPQPFFSSIAPITTDAAGRLWVFGFQGDDAFADLFSSTDYLGRIAIPCPGFQGRASVRERFAALVCEPLEDDAGASLRLYRIVDN